VQSRIGGVLKRIQQGEGKRRGNKEKEGRTGAKSNWWGLKRIQQGGESREEEKTRRNKEKEGRRRMHRDRDKILREYVGRDGEGRGRLRNEKEREKGYWAPHISEETKGGRLNEAEGDRGRKEREGGRRPKIISGHYLSTQAKK
jgi:hypothetical protein